MKNTLMKTRVNIFVGLCLTAMMIFSCQDEEIKKQSNTPKSINDDGIEIFSDPGFNSEDNASEGRIAALPQLKSTITQVNLRLAAATGTTGTIAIRLVRVSDNALIAKASINASALLKRSACSDNGRFVYWNMNKSLASGIKYRIEAHFTPDEEGDFVEWAYQLGTSSTAYRDGNAVRISSGVISKLSTDLRFGVRVTHSDGESQDQELDNHLCWSRITEGNALGQEFTLPADFQNEILETAVLHTLDAVEGSGDHVISLDKLNSIDWLYTPDLWTLEGTTIEEIGYMPNLTTLTLNYISGVDLTPIGDLTKLTYLKARNNPDRGAPVNASAIGRLVNLTNLELENCLITDISWITPLTKLTSISLPYSKVSNLTPLTNLKNLKSLDFRGNLISNLNPLSGLTNLQSLILGKNSIANVAALTALTNLTDLYLNDNKITGLTPISHMTVNLKRLALDNNLLSNVLPLHPLTQLDQVSLYGNPLTAAQITALKQALGNDTFVGF